MRDAERALCPEVALLKDQRALLDGEFSCTLAQNTPEGIQQGVIAGELKIKFTPAGAYRYRFEYNVRTQEAALYFFDSFGR